MKRFEVTVDGKTYCMPCDLDLHRCAGCGESVDCGTVACLACEAEFEVMEQQRNEGAIG